MKTKKTHVQNQPRRPPTVPFFNVDRFVSARWDSLEAMLRLGRLRKHTRGATPIRLRRKTRGPFSFRKHHPRRGRVSKTSENTNNNNKPQKLHTHRYLCKHFSMEPYAHTLFVCPMRSNEKRERDVHRQLDHGYLLHDATYMYDVVVAVVASPSKGDDDSDALGGEVRGRGGEVVTSNKDNNNIVYELVGAGLSVVRRSPATHTTTPKEPSGSASAVYELVGRRARDAVRHHFNLEISDRTVNPSWQLLPQVHKSIRLYGVFCGSRVIVVVVPANRKGDDETFGDAALDVFLRLAKGPNGTGLIASVADRRLASLELEQPFHHDDDVVAASGVTTTATAAVLLLVSLGRGTAEVGDVVEAHPPSNDTPSGSGRVTFAHFSSRHRRYAVFAKVDGGSSSSSFSFTKPGSVVTIRRELFRVKQVFT
eukprot:PhM_4_TR9132/c0_g2_i1/m.34688